MKSNDVVIRLAYALRLHLEAERVSKGKMSEGKLARRLGITHPTLSRMLHAEQSGSGGVSLRNWCVALYEVGYLEPLVSSLERRLSARDPEFMPVPAADEKPDDAALLRIGHALREAVRSSPVPSNRQLAMRIGVTQPTLYKLLRATDPHAGGTAVKHFIRAAGVLGLGGVFAQVLPAPRRFYQPPTNGPAAAGPTL